MLYGLLGSFSIDPLFQSSPAPRRGRYLDGLYCTPYTYIDLLAMIIGYGGKPSGWMGFLAQLQVPGEKA